MSGIINALVNTPISIYLPKVAATEQENLFELFAKVNLLIVAGASVLTALILVVWGQTWVTILSGALFVVCFLLRFAARGFSYALRQPNDATRSDVVYIFTGLLSLACIYYVTGYKLDIAQAFLGVSIGSVLSLFIVTKGWLQRQIFRCWQAPIGSYKDIWKESGRWGLVGVVPVEAVNNGPSYLISFWLGPAAFAPIAVSVLFFRPVSIFLTALRSLETPKMAKDLAVHDWNGVRNTSLFTMGVLVSSWLVLMLAVWFVWPLIELHFLDGKYDASEVWLATMLWGAVFLVRSLREIPSIFFHANRQIQYFTKASFVAGGVSVVLMFILLVMFGAAWSLLALVIGEILLCAILVVNALKVIERSKTEQGHHA
ncbi:MAG: hypothetical protein OXR68_08555 [Alphaproteobacteria bacterium]|nr:hypothetical protein [Alphaproteobacteria bacterium]MDD9920656.1 hypothetical protein [Alphaproteobacteria bacterium]